MTFEVTESGTLFKAGTESALRFILKIVRFIIVTYIQTEFFNILKIIH